MTNYFEESLKHRRNKLETFIKTTLGVANLKVKDVDFSQRDTGYLREEWIIKDLKGNVLAKRRYSLPVLTDR